MFTKKDAPNKRPAGFTEEVMQKIEAATYRAEGRLLTAHRFMARGSRLSGIAREKSDAGELTRESEAGEKIAAELQFYRNEVIGESFMAYGATALLTIAMAWCVDGIVPDSLASALWNELEKDEPVPFTDRETMTATVSSICIACVEQTARVVGGDSTVFDERMPAVLAESAFQIATAITGHPDDSEEYVCDDCAEEHGIERKIKPVAEIQALSIGSDGVKPLSIEELEELYKRDGGYGHGKTTDPLDEDAKKRAEEKRKKKP